MGKRSLHSFVLAGLVSLACVSTAHAGPYTSDQALDRLRDAVTQYRIIASRGGFSQVPAWSARQTEPTHDQRESVRRRLLASGDWLREDFSNSLRRFQHRHGLLSTGYLNRETIAVMNVPASQRLAQLSDALNKATTLKQRIGSNRYVLVNIPSQELVAVAANKAELVSAVIVGHSSRPTPEMTATITGVTFHPAWNVPPGIARDDLIPLLRNNPLYFERENFEILRWRDGRKVLPEQAADQRLTANQIRFRRAPGPRNPLGRVRIDMPNSQAIFLHDTPTTRLFGWPNRSFSSGCVRVSRIVELANWILKDNGWTPQQSGKALRERLTTHVRAASMVPVHLIYLTAWVNPDGQVNFRKDLYGHQLSDAPAAG